MDKTEPVRLVEPFYAGQVTRRLAAISARLHDLAEAVAREATRVPEVGRRGAASYATIASRVQHELLWAFPALHLDQLTDAAADADRVRAEEASNRG
jgi:hypothetical protein